MTPRAKASRFDARRGDGRTPMESGAHASRSRAGRGGGLNPRVRYGGFTLMEALVAFSILSVALALMYQIYARGAVAAILAEEYAAAIAVAETQLARAAVDDRLLVDASGGMDSGVAMRKYHWRITAEDWDNTVAPPPEGSAYRLKKVVARVAWQSRGGERQISIEGIKPYRAP